MNTNISELFEKLVLVLSMTFWFIVTSGRSFTSVRTVLTVLKRHQLKVKKGKCSFGQTQIHYLGHIIGPAGVRADPEKIEAMTTWPQPKYVKELGGFLGLTTGYGILAKPLMIC